MDAKKQEVGELTKWIRLLHSENDEERAEARERVIDAYWQSLTLEIKKKLEGAAKHRVRESDLLQEVWLVFLKRPCRATDSESLRALLSNIVKSTVINSWTHHHRLKRAEWLETSLHNERDSSSPNGLDDVVSKARLPSERVKAREHRRRLPAPGHFTDDSFFGESLAHLTAGATPNDAAVAIDEFNLLLRLLDGKSDLETIVKMSIHGYATSEIARAIGTEKRTVERKLKLIRTRFRKHQEGNLK